MEQDWKRFRNYCKAKLQGALTKRASGGHEHRNEPPPATDVNSTSMERSSNNVKDNYHRNPYDVAAP